MNPARTIKSEPHVCVCVCVHGPLLFVDRQNGVHNKEKTNKKDECVLACTGTCFSSTQSASEKCVCDNVGASIGVRVRVCV